MSPEDNLLMWLFEQTRTVAVRLDSLVNSFTSSRPTLADYRDLLVRTYGFEAPLEAALAYTPGLHHVCELRTGSGRIVHDLLELGMRPQQVAELPQCLIAPFADLATGLGWLYVYERSRLQHPLLCARITERLPDVRNATDYFCRDEIAVTLRWDRFASALERFADTEIVRHKIRIGAVEAFEQAIEWYGGGRMRAVQ